MSTTTIIDDSPKSRLGDFTFIVPQAIPAGVRFGYLEIVMNLADKLAVGNIVVLQSRFSPDGVQPFVFFNGSTVENPWRSYGPGGYTVTEMDGTQIVNPNPRVRVPLLDRAGQRIQVFGSLPQRLSVGIFATITT